MKERANIQLSSYDDIFGGAESEATKVPDGDVGKHYVSKVTIKSAVSER